MKKTLISAILTDPDLRTASAVTSEAIESASAGAPWLTGES